MKNFVERREKVHEYRGQLYSALELSRMAGCTCPIEILVDRLKNKWPVERAMTVRLPEIGENDNPLRWRKNNG